MDAGTQVILTFEATDGVQTQTASLTINIIATVCEHV